MVVVDRRCYLPGGCLQHGSEILHFNEAKLAGAVSCARPSSQSCAVGIAEGCGGRIASASRPSPREHKDERQVAVLINHVGQSVVLVANLEVVRSPPAALEECEALVELIVLRSIDLGEIGIEGSRRSTSWQLQTRRQYGPGVIDRAFTRVLKTEVNALRGPAKVVIVVEEVAVTRGGDDVRGDRDIATNVISRVRVGVAKAVRKLRQRSVHRQI